MAIFDAFSNPYGDAQAMRNPHGAIIVDGRHVGDTVQCAHCGGHFMMVKGSGRIRGFCTRCHGVTCGDPACLPCISHQHRLDLRDGG